jgi:hypothetical protein
VGAGSGFGARHASIANSAAPITTKWTSGSRAIDFHHDIWRRVYAGSVLHTARAG